MRLRPSFWYLVSLLCVVGAWLFWQQGNRWAAERNAAVSTVPPAVTAANLSTGKLALTNAAAVTAAVAKTNEFPYRLTNTPKTIGELVPDRHAILLENALIDTDVKLDLAIPQNLRAQGDPGAYIVQARGQINAAFRALLAQSGATMVSYVPNNAYLVQAGSGVASGLAASALVQSVTPYEPYYKIQSSLLGLAVQGKALPDGAILNLGLFAGDASATLAQIKQLNGQIVGQDSSPFGPVVRVAPLPGDANWAALARLPGVQIVEGYHSRVPANDLSRATTGVAANSVTKTNYLNLSGSNVIVQVNDTGIDANHPDFTAGNTQPSRVFGSLLTDKDGHGTHVAGIIAGDGTKSTTVTNAQGSIMPGTNGQFRGSAPLAKLLSMDLTLPDQTLQEAAARTNALISNNSWNYGGDTSYDLAAASYDAAVRDSLPEVTGSQPVLFVFSAGNNGGGNDGGGGGQPDTILSPGTAKNVITFGAIEQQRNITNIVTASNGSSNAVWSAETDTSYEVAGYSSRGNVGIGTEGAYGRYKPDVVAPGTFVISTRSSQWDTNAYYNPTNYSTVVNPNLTIAGGDVFYTSLALPLNAVSVTVQVVPNAQSPTNFPNFSIFVGTDGDPDPTDPTSYSFVTTNNEVAIPPDTGTGITGIQSIQGGGFNYAIQNNTSNAVNFNLVITIATTNDVGNYYQVLEGMNDGLGGFYRYESGTSMSAADGSGVLALLQDYFINHTAQTNPSPALLKALLINGARSTGNNYFEVTNSINFQGWGLINLPNSLLPGITNQSGASCTSFFLDQSPTNALATGDSRTFKLSFANTAAQTLPLRITLAWTDPPGNPAVALKLVNNLDLVVSNVDTHATYFGNDIPAGSRFNSAWNTNSAPNLDAINNIENVFLPPQLGTNYTVTVIGRSVNVNAVTAQTNNVVQDYALVISCGNNGQVTNAFAVDASAPIISTNAPQITYVTTTNTVLLNQYAGANTPLLGTNTIQLPGATNAQITLGMTNQWHFYVVTNTLGYTNAAFITFIPGTLAVPRMGVFASSEANATQPEADIDLYVSTNASLLVLDPLVISNADKSIGRGGTEFVAYSNSVLNAVYYIGVKSEDQEGAEYGFIPVFSQQPFSTTDQNGNQYVNGIALAVQIPDGSPALPGVGYTFSLALTPMEIDRVIVSNTIVHQNFGDLVGVLQHGATSDVLNNHTSLGNPPGPYSFVYDDSANPIINSQPSAGPGSLAGYVGQEAIGPWILTEVDNALTHTGSVTAFNLFIQPHQDPSKGVVSFTLSPSQWFYTYIDVPASATNLTVLLTNLTALVNREPVDLFVRFGSEPDLTNYDKTITVSNGTAASWSGSISIGPSDVPPIQPGRYYIGIYNPNPVGSPDQTLNLLATFGLAANAPQVNYASAGPTNLIDDAVTYSGIFVTNHEPIYAVNVGLRVDHPRISDLVFHLISPDGTRYLLMENRGGTTTNGCGVTIVTTNVLNASANGGPNATTNFFDTGQTSGSIPINYDMFTIPDEMTVYYSTNLTPANLITNFFVSGAGQLLATFPPPAAVGSSTFLTIVMNATNNPPQTIWTYTVGAAQTNYLYLTFTEDTNLTTTPIKFAVPPFVPGNFFATNFAFSDFEAASATNYLAPATVDGWSVITNQVSVVNDPANTYQGSNFLALANGIISNNIPTVPGLKYTVNFQDRGPGIMSMWRGEGNANDKLGVNNGTLLGGGGYVAGEVGQAFSFNGTSSYVSIPDSPSLDSFSNSITVELWMKAGQLTANADWKGLVTKGNSSWRLQATTFASTVDWAMNGVTPFELTGNRNVNDGQWHHVAAVYDGTHAYLYVDGTLDVSQPATGLIAQNNDPLCIGANATAYLLSCSCPGLGYFFNGAEDEVSIYKRALSASEIKAIYQNGSAGKFDSNPGLSAPQNLAEASVAITGVATNIIFGNNTSWQQQGFTFTATATNTPIIIKGIEPGILLDSFTVSGASGSSLYYQPEESLDLLSGTDAYGLWQLEILDDRVGATNNASLLSWNLDFEFADRTVVPADLGDASPQTNFIAPGGLAWFQIDVPPNADFATNTLFFATGPLGLWFSTNSPPTITNAPLGDVQILSPATSGSVTLGTNSSPAYIIPGGTYYLGVQNTNSFTVQYAVGVTFHLPPTPGPLVITTAATNITFATATLDASVDPNGFNSWVYFEYGTSTNYTFLTSGILLTNNLNSYQAVAIGITNLVPGTVYHYQAIGTNILGTNYGGDLTFTSLVTAPFVFTQPAQAVTGTNALLNGMATPNGLPSVAWFQWGTNTFYGSNTPPVNVGSGFNVVYTNAVINGLGMNTAYHFRMVVSNAFMVTYGFDQVLDEANVVAWGANYAGQLNVPTNLNSVVAIAGAYDHSLELKTNGLISAWGDNSFGQTTVPANASNVLAVAGGQYYSMALNRNGTVTAWGANILNATAVPTGLSNVVAIAGGTLAGLALKSDGSVVTWGANISGLTAVPASASNTVAIAGGGYHSLALKNNGTVTAWGDNSSGQTSVPPGLSNVVAIAAGGYHSLALLTNGTVVAWGENGAGQTNVPAGLSNVVAVAAGGFHSLALKKDGTVVAWGDNTAGQTNVLIGLSKVVAITAGYLHSMALTPYFNANPTNPIVLNFSNSVPQPGNIGAGGVIYYQVNVPTNADYATNSLLFALNGPLNVWFTTNSPPTLVGASPLLAGVTNGVSILSTISTPTNIVPGGTYYLGVQNTNSFSVNYSVQVDFHLTATNSTAQTNTVAISSVVYTNGGFLLTWFAPSNALFQVQFTTNLAPANWITFTNIIGYNTNAFTSPTNTQFNFFDNGGQYPFGPSRFYQLILLSGALPANTLTLPAQSNFTASVSTLVTVTNTAMDSNTNAILTYSLLVAPTNAAISTNGIITWTNAAPAGLAARFTTLVTDNGAPPASATNTFTIFVAPLPSITNVTFTATNVSLIWSAPTNDQFNVRWATNLAPPIGWSTFPGIITSTNGLFSFTDTNLPLVMKFYQLILLP